MKFVYPEFLWALVAILIPVIIHLFYFKRFKKVYFTNTRFLKEIKEETTHKNKLKNLLVLIARILAIAALVFAFAQPYIPAGDNVKQGSKGVSIYVDNSFSMQAVSGDVSLLDNAKKIAKDIITAYPDNTVFQVLTNKLYGSEQKWINKENALERIENIKLSPAVKKFKNIAKRQASAFDKTSVDNKYAFWISDFQKSVFDLAPDDIDTTIDYNLVMLQPVREKNISVDSCFLADPVPVVNHTNELLVKITNNSGEDVTDIPVNLNYDGQNYPAGKVDIKAHSSVLDTIKIRIKKKGWNSAKISIIDYPVVFDDEYYVCFEVPEILNILEINNTGKATAAVKALFDNSDMFSYDVADINHINYAGLDNYALIILNDITSISSGLAGALQEAVYNGANVLIFPAPGASINSINAFLNKIKGNVLLEYKNQPNTADRINENEFVFKDVYENSRKTIKAIHTKAYYKISRFSNSNSYPVIKFKTGDSFLERTKYGLGNVYLAAVPLQEDISDLLKNPAVFVPLLFNIAISADMNRKLAYVIGKDKIIGIKAVKLDDTKPVKIKNENSEFIPKQIVVNKRLKIDVDDQIQKPGIYVCTTGDKVLKTLAFNYDRTESRLDYVDEANLKLKFGEIFNIYGPEDKRKDFGQLIKEKQSGKELWKVFILLALLFLLLEILLLRFWKNKK